MPSQLYQLSFVYFSYFSHFPPNRNEEAGQDPVVITWAWDMTNSVQRGVCGRSGNKGAFLPLYAI